MNHTKSFKLSVSTAALLAVSAAGLDIAKAQDSGAAAPIETVTVTGTAFRGVAPLGSNLIAVTAADLQTSGGTSVTEQLSTLPELTGMGVADREQGDNVGRAGSTLYIHGIGTNADSSTLILVDGHRGPLGNGIVDEFNPNNVPSMMIQRVDVLAEGASAVYGADAVAGVVNLITVNNFDGLEVRYSGDMEKGQISNDFGLLTGQSWDRGGFVFGLDYQTAPELFFNAIPQTNPLSQPARALADGLPVASQPAAVTNFGNFNCNPATIQLNGAGNIYVNAQGTTNFANAAANSICQQTLETTIFPSTRRIDSMIKVHETLGKLFISADLDYAHRQSTGQSAAGVLTATAFATGTQANPFYLNPPGTTSTKQQIRYDFDGLVAPAAAITGESYVNGSVDAVYTFDDNWSVDLLVDAGVNNVLNEQYGGVNIGLATLALNGTTQSSGSTTATSIPGYNATTLNLPLTTANALDVWDPVSSNKTSAATLASLINAKGMTSTYFSVTQMRLSTQGTLFQMPAGDVKLNVGVEIFNESTYENTIAPENNAGANVASAYSTLNLHRGDKAEFAEMQVPIVSSAMNVPFMQKLEVNLAVRRDSYTDFGNTVNPKVSAAWTVNDDVSLRANASTSFVAPTLPLTPSNGFIVNANIGPFTAAASVPVALYPTVTQFGIAGCTTASITCPINTLTGIRATTGTYFGGSPKALTGRTWGIGADVHPEWLPGFSASVTYWHVSLLNGINSPPLQLSVDTPALTRRLQLYPNCASPAAVNPLNLPLTGPFPACIQFLDINDSTNYVTFYVDGIDSSVQYKYDTDSLGSFTVGDTMSLLTYFHQGFCYQCAATTTFNILNTTGINSPSLGLQTRAHLGWAMDAFAADFFMNWTGAYTNLGTSVTPIAVNSVGQVTGGGDHVNANITYDAHLGYSFGTEWTGADQLSLTVKNLLNTYPPYINLFNLSTNGASGYDSAVANPLGRTYTLNLTTRF